MAEETEEMQEHVSLEKEVFQIWRSIGQSLGLESDTKIAAFVIHCYQEKLGSWSPPAGASCIQCGSALRWMCPSCGLLFAHKGTEEQTNTQPENQLCVQGTEEQTNTQPENQQACPDENQFHQPHKNRKLLQKRKQPKPLRKQAQPQEQIMSVNYSEKRERKSIVKLEPNDDGGVGLGSDFVTGCDDDNVGACIKDEGDDLRCGSSACRSTCQTSGLTSSSAMVPSSLACPYSAMDVKGIQEKRNTESHRKSYQSSECGKEFKSLSGLKRHGCTHKCGAQFVCEVCNKGFTTNEGLRTHQLMTICHQFSHSSAGFIEDQNVLNLGVHSRTKCEASFTGKKCPLEHQTSTNISNYRPEDLNEKTMTDHKSKDFRIRGRRKKKKGKKKDPDVYIGVDLSPHLCEHCGKHFPERYRLMRHKKSHCGQSNPASHSCDICQKACSTKANLERHRQVHSTVKARTASTSYVCHLCGKLMRTSAGLNYHMKFHTGQKNHVCEFCNKRFILAGQLREHKFIHATHKPHVCEVCSKSFSHLGSLKKHKMFHADQKHVCSTCGKKFYQVCHLKRHELIHLGKKPWVCSVCCKAFTQNTHLKQHQSVHNREIRTVTF